MRRRPPRLTSLATGLLAARPVAARLLAAGLLATGLLAAGLLPGLAHAGDATPIASAQAESETQTPAADGNDEPPGSPGARVERYELDNGLLVTLAPDASSSEAATCLTLPFGSRNDPPDYPGAAWLLHRLLIHPVATTELGLAAARARAVGSRADASFEVEQTHLLQTFPDVALEAAVVLAAAQLRESLPGRRDYERARASQASGLESRVDAPETTVQRKERQLALQGLWPYSHPKEGTAGQIRLVPRRSLQVLHHRAVRVERATLTVAGHFPLDRARELVALHLGPLRRRSSLRSESSPSERSVPSLPRQTMERFSVGVSKALAEPLVSYAWSLPGDTRETRRALELAGALLTGSGSRLVSTLSTPKALAHALEGALPSDAGPSIFALRFRVRPGATVDDARAVIDRELADPRSRALELSRSRSRSAEPTAPAVPEPSSADVRRAVRRWLHDQPRSTVELYPPGWQQDLPPAIVKRKHRVARGENLISIARRHGTTVEAIAKENGIRRHRFIYPGQELVIPIRTRPTRPARRRGETYVVKRGDSLALIARRHGVTARVLEQTNDLARGAVIVPGQRLEIPPKGKATKDGSRRYRVQKGDSWIGIARRHGLSVEVLARANGRSPKQSLYAGEWLRIPPNEKRRGKRR